MSMKLSRDAYAKVFGPTTGDRVRLADTELFVEVEKDHTVYGEEILFATGKTARDGMGVCPIADRDTLKAADLIITNALIIDHWGIVKADIAIREGRIVGIGKAGNPLIQPGVDPNLVMGPGTEIYSAEGKILTAGFIDPHVHFICPQLCWTALYAGFTSLLGGGSGPNTGTKATTCTPGPWHIERMLQASEGLPVNVAWWGKGNGSTMPPLEEQIKAGAPGLKVHEDWCASPAVLDAALRVGDKYDVQITLHTDTMNESGYLADTIAAIGGRTIHTYHTEGAGGGHAPDIMEIASFENMLPSSTNAPSRPYTINSVDEGVPMVVVTHNLNASNPADLAFAESRVRAETMAAEGILHDYGILSIMSSDSQAMGRIGETGIRTFQAADKMKRNYGDIPAKWSKPGEKADNFRVKRNIAKLTINPAIAHGFSEHVGSVEVGKYADLVVWRPDFFAIKPETVFKCGLPIMSQIGDINASIPTPQPVLPRDMFGAFGKALSKSCITFVSQVGYDNGIVDRYGLERMVIPVKNTRNLKKKDMVLNGNIGKIEIDPDTFLVRLDGELLPVDAAKELSMTQRYFLF